MNIFVTDGLFLALAAHCGSVDESAHLGAVLVGDELSGAQPITVQS
jgi:hypothetical protein